MSEGYRYGPMSEMDASAVMRLIVHAFAGTAEGTQRWLESAGHENVRVLRPDGRARTGCDGAAGTGAGALGARESGAPVSCLLRVPMGQHFGGRSVGMLGVAGVGVAPEARGRGHAKTMMEACVREAAADGFALSALYPSTQALYRSVGYEQAGHRMMARVPLVHIDCRERAGEIVPLGEGDWPAVKACYGAFAPRFDGMLDRGSYVWGRVPKQQDNVFNGFGVPAAGGGLDGYVFLMQKRKETGRQEIVVQDFAFRTAAAGRRLLRFLADFATMGDEVVFPCGPSHPALMMLGLQKYKLEFTYYWMIRVVSVERALGERGYPAGARGEVHLEVGDGVIPENAGRWVLKVSEGRGSVERGGRGEVRLDVRALAALYSGHMSGAGLALAGMVEGEERAIAAAGAVFGGGSPWMTDFF